VRIPSLLQIDPELGEAIPLDRRAAALTASEVATERVPEGPWTPADSRRDGFPGFGLLVVSGFLVRRVGREGRFGAELLGQGDLLRPWQAPGRVASRPFESEWQAVTTARLAVLDHEFARRVAPFPEIAERLVDRAMLRSRHLALELAIVQQRRIEDRLLMLLWLLADRWGYVTGGGVRLRAPLTHALLAELVAARRPSVTTALGNLAESGEVVRSGGDWVLRAAPEPEVD
jgi:CRP/FNR family transcriptional regulator, cyclic AMP receptor protein